MLNKLLLSSFLSFSLAQQAWAEAGHGDAVKHVTDDVVGEVGHVADVEHAASGGLPQFDPTWFASQIFWLAITFVVLYVFFAKKTLPEISGVIENRKNHIQADLESAEKITAEADEVQNAYQEGLNKAQSDAADAIKKVESNAKAKAEKAIDDFKHKSDVALKETEKRIEASKLVAMDDMSDVAAKAAAQAVEKIIGVTPDTSKIETAIKNINGKFQSDKAKAA